MNPRKFPFLISGSLVWVLLVGAGFIWLVRYEFSPGRDAKAPGSWPDESRIERAPDHPTLLMFAHPRCPCTRASVAELARLVAQCQDQARIVVLFFRPKEGGEDWAMNDLWRNAASIPGVVTQEDEDGVEARRFGSETSGQLVLYDAQGRLMFEGGITASRGHEGDNAGRSALVAILNDGWTGQIRTPVFGCSISDPEMAQQSEP